MSVSVSGSYIMLHFLLFYVTFLSSILIIIIIITIIIIIINRNWFVNMWQWLFYMYTEYEVGYY